MKILAVSDLHGVMDVYRWLTRLVSSTGPDAVVLPGDLLSCPDGYETIEAAQRASANAILEELAVVSIPVFYIMGNDDLVELEPHSDAFQSLHGTRVDLGGWNFVGYQYSLPFMGGTFEKTDDEIRDELTPLKPLVDSRTVFVTHNPALGILDLGMLDLHAGSQAILDFVVAHRPLIHVCGHIHEQFGRKGHHFNVASGGHRRGMVIDLETLEHHVLGDSS